MPRSRPRRVRAAAACRRSRRGHQPAIEGLSTRAVADIVRLEQTRNYLSPGDVVHAVSLWRRHVHLPLRKLWHGVEGGEAYDCCCDDPLGARALIDSVIRALPARSGRELRMLVVALDAVRERKVPHRGPAVDRPG